MPHRGIGLAALVALALTACGQFDTIVSFDIRNDGTATVRVVMCGNTCAKHHEVVDLQPGHTAPFNASVGGPGELFAVEAPSGEVRCLDVLVRHESPRLTVQTSTAIECDPKVFRKGSTWDQVFG